MESQRLETGHGLQILPETWVTQRDRAATRRLVVAFVLLVVVAGVLFTEWRLWQGIDLRDEAYYVEVPYRMAVGSHPFVDDMTVFQLPAMLEYPFVKPFVALQHGHATGIVMYTRHLYLLFMLCVAAAQLFALRRVVRWEYAALIATLYVSFVFIARPQLSYNTMGAGFLTLGAAFGLLALLPSKTGAGEACRGRPSLGWLVLAGVVHGLAAFAFPTLWIMPPVFAACLAVILWRMRPAAPPGQDDGDRSPTWAGVVSYCAGAGALFAVEVVILASFGIDNVVHTLRLGAAGAERSNQANGLSKLLKVVEDIARFFWGRPYLIAAALALYLLFRYRPNVARALLVFMPLPLYLGGDYYFLQEGGFAIVLVFLLPYYYIFVPRRHRRLARVLLLWCGIPACAAGLVTAWTSADGFWHAAVGLMPGFSVSCVLLVWAVTDGWSGLGEEHPAIGKLIGRGSAMALVLLAGVIAVTVVYQFQFIVRYVPYSQLTAWVSSGPYWGVHTTPDRKAYLRQLQDDLAAEGRPSDRLLVYSEFPAAYLLWPYRTAAASSWIGGSESALPRWDIDWMRERHVVPDLVLRTVHPGRLTNAQYVRRYGLGLGDKVVLRRADYVLLRRQVPAAVSAL